MERADNISQEVNTALIMLREPYFPTITFNSFMILFLARVDALTALCIVLFIFVKIYYWSHFQVIKYNNTVGVASRLYLPQLGKKIDSISCCCKTLNGLSVEKH